MWNPAFIAKKTPSPVARAFTTKTRRSKASGEKPLMGFPPILFSPPLLWSVTSSFWGAGKDQLEAALLLQPKNTEAEVALGQALLDLKKFPEATEQLESMSRVHPDNTDILDLLAHAYGGAGKKDRAEQTKRRALRVRNRKASKS